MANNIKRKKPPIKRIDFCRKALNDMCAKHPHYVLKSILLGVLFFTGAALAIWGIEIYRVTFISAKILTLVWVITGVLITPLFKKTFNIYCFNPYTPGYSPVFFHVLFNTVSFGSILIFLFMFINQTFGSPHKTVITLPVVSYGHFAKTGSNCGKPYANVLYKGQEKELVFDCDTKIQNYKSVQLQISTGLFGFNVITNQTLTRGQ